MRQTSLFSFPTPMDAASRHKKDDDSDTTDATRDYYGEKDSSACYDGFNEVDLLDDPESPRSAASDKKSSVPWKNSASCAKCKESFNFFLRRHHCRMCGNSVCSQDSSMLKVSAYFGDTPDEVASDNEPTFRRTCHACRKHFRTKLRSGLSPSPVKVPCRRIGNRNLVRRDSPVVTEHGLRKREPSSSPSKFREPASPLRVRMSDSDDDSSEDSSDDEEDDKLVDSGAFLMGLTNGCNVHPATASELVFGGSQSLNIGPASVSARRMNIECRQPKALAHDFAQDRRGSLRRGAF
jgi:hypothetical protein